MKFVNRLKFTAQAATSAATVTPSGGITGFRTLVQAIADGKLALNESGVPFNVADTAGSWEDSYFKVTGTAQAPTLTRESIVDSSSNGAAPTYTGPLTVWNTMFADYAAGGTVLDLPLLSAAAAGDFVMVNKADASGAYRVAASSLGSSTSGTTPPATATLTVNTPASPQTVSTAYTVTGTWGGVQPTALDYQLSDGGGAWVAAASPTFATTGTNTGTYSFSVTPASASTGRTITVRDHNATTVVSAASGSYVVNAAAASGSPDYLVTLVTAASPGFPTAQAAGWTSGEAPVGVGAPVINIKAADNSVPNAADLKFVIGASSTVPPIAYADGSVPLGAGNTPGETGNTTVHSNSVISGAGAAIGKSGNWTLGSDAGGGNFKPVTGNFYVWTSSPFPRSFCLWVLGLNGFKKPVRDSGGNVVWWTVSQ